MICTGRPLYHIDWLNEEIDTYFDDDSHIIYANGSYKYDHDLVEKLMYDFRCLSSADMFYQY